MQILTLEDWKTRHDLVDFAKFQRLVNFPNAYQLYIVNEAKLKG